MAVGLLQEATASPCKSIAPAGRGWRSVFRAVAPVLLFLLLTFLRAGSARADVAVALTPSPAQVAPGDTFELDLTVTEAGSSFNGFDAYLHFDSQALTFLGFSPVSLQIGSLMTGACPNTFHRFTAIHDSLSITDVLLCSGISVTGPGPIYRLRFKASATQQVTHVTFLPGLQFYNGGLYVNPSHSTDGTVQIGNVLSVGPGPASASPLRLRCAQNPFSKETSFRVESRGGASESLVVRDVSGRMVRHLESGNSPGGSRTVVWDGLSDGGGPVAAGVYLVSLTDGGRAANTRVVRTR